jgi:hypothetical protein
MPRTQIRGTQTCDGSITTADLADGAVTTQKLQDLGVTEQKLTSDLAVRLLSTASPVGRVHIGYSIPTDTDIPIPGGFVYSSITDFLERMIVMLDGQMMYNGASIPISPNDPIDVYPGSSNSMIRFSFALKRGSRIQVVRL